MKFKIFGAYCGTFGNERLELKSKKLSILSSMISRFGNALR
jgi:hypothetical protein